MTRTRVLVAMIAAAALTLGACSSDTAGSPTASETPTSSAAAGTTADDTADDTADTVTESDGAEGDTDAAESTTGDSEDTSDVVPATLDAQSTAWFSEFCGIGKPFDDFFGSLMSAAMVGAGGEPGEADLVQARDSLKSAFQDLGDAMSGVGAKLATMDPPTVDQGAESAANTVAGLTKGGPMLAAVAEQIGQLDTSSAEAFSTALNSLMDSLGDMGDSLGIDDLSFDAETKAAVQQLPGCQGSLLFSDSF